MELRERIAQTVLPISRSAYADFAEADDDDRATALEIADAVIDALGLTREEERVEPRPGSTTKFAPYMAERYVTLWGARRPRLEQEHILNTHTDTLAEWWENADNDTVTHPGDTLIKKGRSGFEIFEVAHEDTAVHIDALPNCRLLQRVPAPKPAWHDAPAVVAHVDDFRGAQRRVFVRRAEDFGGIRWGDEFSEWPSGELIDPVPLIEAKVTDEMVGRIRELEDGYGHKYFASPLAARELLAAALGLDPA